LLIAMPSFWAFRQRAATRAAAEHAASFWNQARFEAVKRNSAVKIGFVTLPSNAGYCIGAATVDDTTDHAACDCSDVTACNVGRWPEVQTDWNDVTISGTPTLGPSGANAGVTVIEPKRTSLVDSTDEGVVSFAGPPGGKSYRLNLLIDRFGRAKVCESAGATDKMSDFYERRCSP